MLEFSLDMETSYSNFGIINGYIARAIVFLSDTSYPVDFSPYPFVDREIQTVVFW